jgi:2-methylcitrate dehydratase PrpD
MAAKGWRRSNSTARRLKSCAGTSGRSVAADPRLLPDLAVWVAALRAPELDAAMLDRLKLHALDALGCASAGAVASEFAATRDALLDAAFSSRPKTLLDHPACAAALLVTACRLTECDDIHIGSCVTPSSVVVPVAVLWGHRAKAPRDRTIEAMLAGYQVMVTLGLAARGAENVYRGVWPTYLTGGIAAAAIAAKVMGLKEEQIRDAMAIAASSATGVTGRIEKEPAPRWLALASAVQAGLLAATAASRGMHGDETILAKVSPVWSAEKIALPDSAGPAAPLHLARIGFKPYCTSRQGLAATEAFIAALRAHRIEPGAIEKITLAVPLQYRAMIDRAKRPKTKSESRGIHYQLALAALYPDELCDIERATLHSEEPAVQHLLDRIEVTVSDKLTTLYPRQWGGAVRIEADGRAYENEVLNPRGDPETPLGRDGITAKLETMSRFLPRPIPTAALARQVEALDFAACLETLIARVA